QLLCHDADRGTDLHRRADSVEGASHTHVSWGEHGVACGHNPTNLLGALAVKVRHTINREGAKSAKNFAKQNSFQESKDFRVSSAELGYPEHIKTAVKGHGRGDCPPRPWTEAP